MLHRCGRLRRRFGSSLGFALASIDLALLGLGSIAGAALRDGNRLFQLGFRAKAQRHRVLRLDVLGVPV